MKKQTQPLLPREIDPFTVTTNKNDWEKFYSLDLFGQMDAAVNHASKPNIKTVFVFFAGLIWWCVNAVGCLALTSYTSGEELWSMKFHETLLKNVIAWDAIAYHHGIAMFYRLAVGAPEARVKFKIGSIKDSLLPIITGRRRNIFDILVHFIYDASRIWLLKTVDPSPLCAWCVFGSTAALYIFDYGEYVGGNGMFHGPWSVFIVAKYCTASQTPATALMQFLLQLLYIGCGLGKMGPWFVGMFNQEWTLPPWALKVDIGPWLYNKNFPKDNTPSLIGSSLAYLAASIEWIAPLLMLCTSAVVGGPGTPYVHSGIFMLIAMHFYINFHMSKIDLWMLNFTPAYILYNVYYISPHISEAGFDYELFAQLHPGFQAFCWFMLAYCIFGQCNPKKMGYMNCYRFWAGNWPQSYVLISEKGMEKVKTSFPSHTKAGLPGAVFAKVDGPLWVYEWFGFSQTTQLSHRVMPMLVHKGLRSGAALRGEDAPKSLTDFQKKSKGLFCAGFMFFNWGVGYMANDALRHPHLIEDFQQLCNFKPGECVLLFSNSFPVFAGVTGSKSYWSVIDANKGILDEGWVTVAEALSITRPSIWRDYEKKST